MPLWAAVSCALLFGAAACGDGGPATGPGGVGSTGIAQSPTCLPLPLTINSGGVHRDGIPALTNPTLVSDGHPGAEYVGDDDRVVGVVLGDDAIAVPYRVLWWHEVVNLDRVGRQVAVTFCPLTGSAVAFDRSELGGVELGVSGLLYDNNLVMYDRSGDESLWAQMPGLAICGVRRGGRLPMARSIVTTWGRWRELHPQTTVVSSSTGYPRDYGHNPYEDYWRLDAAPLFSERLSDLRRPPKELLLGIPEAETQGVLVPLSELPPGRNAAFTVRVAGEDVWVLWEGKTETAVALRIDPTWAPHLKALPDDFVIEAVDDGFRDSATGSIWRIDGLAVEGLAVGSRLRPVEEAFVAFWFAWTVLRPDMEVLDPPRFSSR